MDFQNKYLFSKNINNLSQPARRSFVNVHKKHGLQPFFCFLVFNKGALWLVLGSKTLGTKYIRTSICNVLANHDQNLEFRFRLLKVCLCVKLESSDCRIYWTKFTRLDRSEIRLDRSNLVQIVFFYRISNSAQAHMMCRVLCFALRIKGKTLTTFYRLLICCVCEPFVRSRGVYLHTHLGLSRSRLMSRTW